MSSAKGLGGASRNCCLFSYSIATVTPRRLVLTWMIPDSCVATIGKMSRVEVLWI